LRIAILPALALLLGTGPPSGAPRAEVAAPKIEDIFGRSLADHGLVLVDWEGYIANPAIRFVLVPPPDAAYPARVVVRCREPRLYSIAHHELGHALIFNAANTRFAAAKLLGLLENERIKAYVGADPAVDRDDHLARSVDPASLHGAFGNEYHGGTPRGRWLITKLDLLCAQAIGYRLRETSAFVPLDLPAQTLPDGAVSIPYVATLRAVGAIPFRQWKVVEGALPDGLELDSFTGELRGIPRRSGLSEFTVRVRDYDVKGEGRARRFQLKVAGETRRKGMN